MRLTGTIMLRVWADCGLEAIGMTQVAEGQNSEAASTAGPPDWAAIAEEIACPLCEYNLRGLAEPRCPECGYRFSWREMLDPGRRRHPYLFEQHPEHNVRSFIRTLTGGLRPRRFWTSLNPMQPSDGRRLSIYCLVVSLASVTAFSLVAPLEWILEYVALRWMYRLPLPSNLSELIEVIRTEFQWHPPSGSSMIRWAADFGVPFILWPLFSYFGLSILRFSLNKKRLRPIHVARAIIYSADLGLWMAVLLISQLTLKMILVRPISLFTEDNLPLVLFSLGFVTVFAYRLYRAYRDYLRFDHPFATVLSSQIIALLISLIIILPVHLSG